MLWCLPVPACVAALLALGAAAQTAGLFGYALPIASPEVQAATDAAEDAFMEMSLSVNRTQILGMFAPKLAALCAALLLVACGGGGEESSDAAAGGASSAGDRPASGVIDACKLVTKSEAEAALGSPMADGETDSGTAARCTYHTSDTSKPDTVFVRVGKGRAEKDAFALAKNLYADAKPVDGFGDQAFIVELGAPVVQVHILKGDTYLTVAVTDIEERERLVETARALAKTATGRL